MYACNSTLPPRHRAIGWVLIATMIDALVASVALYYTFGYWGLFSIVLLLLVPFAGTLVNVWQHTLIDLKLVQKKLAALHLASADQTA